MKRTYHTDLQIQHKFGILDKNLQKTIPKSTLHSWKNSDTSKIIGCDVVLSDEKIELIKAFLENKILLNAGKGLYFVYTTFVQDEQYKNFPLVSIFYEMMRKGKAFMSLASFYKYAKYFDNVANRKLSKPKQKTGIRATKPKEIIHADVCV